MQQAEGLDGFCENMPKHAINGMAAAGYPDCPKGFSGTEGG